MHAIVRVSRFGLIGAWAGRSVSASFHAQHECESDKALLSTLLVLLFAT